MKINPIPEDCGSVTPYLTVPDVARLIEFLKNAFDATERARISRPDATIMHAQVLIGNSVLMLGQPQSPWKPQPSMLYHYVADVDTIYRRALEAGAVSVVEPANMFYGDRHACVKDFAENQWWIASRIENLTLEQIQERAAAFLKQQTKPG